MKKAIVSCLLVTVFTALNAQVKVSILGDSYSTFTGCVPEGQAIWYGPGRGNDVQDVADTWWYRLIEDNALELELNNSWSGSTICNTGHGGADYTDRSFLTRSGSLGENPDIIFVFGGTNDDWVDAPLGDADSNDMYAVRPATKAMLKNIKKVYPEALCVVIINTELKKTVEDILIEECEAQGVHYVKLTNIDKQKGHPSINGMRQISKQVWKSTAPLLYEHLKNK